MKTFIKEERKYFTADFVKRMSGIIFLNQSSIMKYNTPFCLSLESALGFLSKTTPGAGSCYISTLYKNC